MYVILIMRTVWHWMWWDDDGQCYPQGVAYSEESHWRACWNDGWPQQGCRSKQ